MIEHNYLKNVLDYNPETGLFFWKENRNGRNLNCVAGSLNKDRGYRYIMVDHKLYREHRLAWFYTTGEWPDEVDHINGVRDDNRWANLREANRSRNAANTKLRVDNTSGYKGVYFNKQKNKWQAIIQVNKKVSHLGYFSVKEDAAIAYNSSALENFGEFARLNEIINGGK